MTVCLMLHGLGTPSPAISAAERPYWLPVPAFANIVDLVRGSSARLTFDDGNASDLEIALPTLLDAGLTASFFIPSDRIGQPGYLSEDGVRALHAAGMEIGSHGCAHLNWTAVSDEMIAQDVMRSFGRLGSIIGERIRAVAVPFGACDRRILRVLKALGVGRVYSSFSGPNVGDKWIVRRDCIRSDMPEAEIRRRLERDTGLDAALAFLRAWRHAGRAAAWPI